MRVCRLLRKSFLIYWKSVFIVIYPLILLPIFVTNNTAAMRCLYLVALMAGFWTFEVIPIPVTSMFPIVFLPLMGILDARSTSMAYFKETNLTFLGSQIIALALEFSNLHTRISLIIIRLIGCSYRRLNFALVTFTMLISMWNSNTAIAALMLPINEAILTELEVQGLAKRWQPNETMYDPEKAEYQDPSPQRSTPLMKCFYISTAYAATIGGLGCIVGSGTNLQFKKLYENEFPQSPGVEYNKWLAANFLLMVIIMYTSWVWLQFWYMGLGQPTSQKAQAIYIKTERKIVTMEALNVKLTQLGPMSTHEILVAILVVSVIFMWVFLNPVTVAGWPTLFTQTHCEDSTAAFLIVLLLFVLPSKLDFMHMWHKDETRRPNQPSSSLITWRYIKSKIHWNLIFQIGGGFALAEGIHASGMRDLASEQLATLSTQKPILILIVISLIASFSTQFISNNEVANIILPMAANIAKKSHIHPIYLMMPVCLSSSFSFCIPVATPPNSLVAGPANMRVRDLLKAGWMLQVISILTLFAIFPNLGGLIWNFSKFPSWARENATDGAV